MDSSLELSKGTTLMQKQIHDTYFLQHANHGVLAERNLGLQNACGNPVPRVPNALVKLARLQAIVAYCMFDYNVSLMLFQTLTPLLHRWSRYNLALPVTNIIFLWCARA